jgi:predicted transcriptional regulator
MAALSITLPDNLAKASQEAAHKLGVSRAYFIRQAITHELQHFQKQLEEEAMVKSAIAMRDHAGYLAENAALDDLWSDVLPDEPDQWWTK